MNKIIINYIAIAIIAFTPMVIFASPVPVVDDVKISQTPAPTIKENSNSSATPTIKESISTAKPSEWSPVIIVTTPNTTDDSTSSVSPIVNESVSTAVPPTPIPTPTPNNSSGSSSGSRSIGNVYGCPMITSFMKYGANNDTVQVTKLQNFLKNVEKIDVDINGIFDKKTESAVKTFQDKYSVTTMGPWGASQGTGFVYITTLKQINKIACNQPLTLSASELAVINAKKNAQIATTQSVTITPKETPASVEIEVGKTENNTITFESETKTDENVATVGKASIMSRFWNFMVYLFK